ncbi:MAG TPA: TonB-dependent receptor [Vicinamibacterales bacterium]|nr:TonB-dependent receptor [Vicinamibacterales bacterium]
MRLCKCLLALCLVLSMAGAASAQVQSGTIAGTVTDSQGGVLPGVTVSLTSADRTATFVTDTTGQYRFLALPPGMYSLTFELTGFQSISRQQVEVRIGQNVDLPIRMTVASVQETVNVIGESPIIDARQMGTATNFTQDELSRIPTSRDPWALLRTVPGVTVDRVNIAGNETGQQTQYTAKGVPGTQSTWTLDGVVVTDMAATGASPSYFDYDAFEEIQISTAGNDIRQPTGGVGMNLVVKRGSNQLRGGLKGFYTGDSLEATNIPDELAATGVTAETADHNEDIMEWGGDAGFPLVKDRLWFWGSYVEQDIRLFRRQVNGIDRTVLKTINAKSNWQATSKDMVSFLWFNGDKEKYGRGTGFGGIEARTATWNQGGFFGDSWPKGLWKIQNDRAWSARYFMSAKYAYYNTGFTLDPIGGLELQAGQSSRLGQTFGSFFGFYYRRPQHTINVDNDYFFNGLGGDHNVKFGFGWRQVDSSFNGVAPGDMVFAFDDPGPFTYALLYREANSLDRARYANFYVGDTISRNRMTLDLGVRYDRQWGAALPTETRGNLAFPSIVPGLDFAGYDLPFTWNNFSPRLGMTYALDAERRTILRASFSMAPGQLQQTFVSFANPTGANGYSLYGWDDLNGDHLAQRNEVRLDQFITAGGGFNPNNPTSTTSPNRIDPDFTAPVTRAIIVGLDRELRPNLAFSVNYSFTRTNDYEYTPRLNAATGGPLGPEFYEPIAPLTGTFPSNVGGGSYNISLFRPLPAQVTAANFGRLLTNYDGYYSQYNGLEFQLTKRLSDRWMARVSAAWNNPREYYDMATPVNYLGNPTRRDTEPLQDGGLFAPRSAGSGAGDVFIAGRWSLNANGVYQFPWLEVAANLFGRDGTPYPMQRTTSLGSDTGQRVLVSPELDTESLESLWNLDLRASRTFTGRVSLQVFADLFNVMNGNSIINRIRDVGSTRFFVPTQNLSPRIIRFGARVGF